MKKFVTCVTIYVDPLFMHTPHINEEVIYENAKTT